MSWLPLLPHPPLLPPVRFRHESSHLPLSRMMAAGVLSSVSWHPLASIVSTISSHFKWYLSIHLWRTTSGDSQPHVATVERDAPRPKLTLHVLGR